MICSTCQASTARVRIIKGIEHCSSCGGFSEANGSTEGVLARQRVSAEAVKFEGDVLNPWKYDKASKKFEPNDDFIKRHAVNAQNFYKPEDLKAYPKLKDNLYSRVDDTPKTSHIGEFEPAIKQAIKEIS